MKYYVAYGSNLNVEQMSYRCPTAELVATGVIKNYTLVFRGSKTGAYATIIPKRGDQVPVAVWNIRASDERALDIYEGYPTFYYKKSVTVHLQDGRTVRAMAYIMFDEARWDSPTARYMKTCVRGYIDMGLDVDKFFEFLENNYNGK